MKDNKSRLSDIDKGLPFKVPDSYFDNFYANLKAKIDSQEQVVEPVKKQKVFHLNFNWKHAISIAATILLFVVMSSDIFKTNANFSLEDYYDLDEYDLYSLTSETSVQENLNSEEIINYLSSTSTDYEIFVELNK